MTVSEARHRLETAGSRWRVKALSTVGAHEAKIYLAALLARVEKGERITITRYGMPVAVLSAAPRQKKSVDDAIAEIRRLRKGNRLDGLSLRELVREGRR